MAKNTTLPRAVERLDRLIALLAKTLLPGGEMDSSAKRLTAKVGCGGSVSTQWVVDQALWHRS